MGSDGSLRPDRSRFENTLVLFSRMLHGYLDGRISLTEAGSFQNVLKAAAEGCGMHVGEGCWWLADLAETREYALNNLGYESEDRIGDWQLQTRAEKIQQNSSESAVVLVSRGHFSSFQNTTVYRTNEFSPYSQEQRKKMTKEFKRAQRDLDWDIYASIPDNARVRSESGALYNSVTDYLYSWEHQSDRRRELDNYSDSLVSRSKINTTYAYSNSRDFSMVHLIAQYTHTNGTLVTFAPIDYRLIDQEGNVPDGYNAVRFDPLVIAADFIEKDRGVQKVSPALFNGTYEPLPSTDMTGSLLAYFMIVGDKVSFQV